MSINQIISYVPQSAFQQMNKFVNTLGSVDKKIYFFATAIAGLSVLLASREIKSRKLEKKVVELNELNKNYSKFCDELNNLLIDKQESNSLNKQNISDLIEENKCLIKKNCELNNKISEFSLINNVMERNQRELINEVQSIRTGMQVVTNNQSYIYNHINIELQGLSQRQEERHEEVLENLTEVQESQIHWSRTINDKIHVQVIKVGMMLSQKWSQFAEASQLVKPGEVEGMSFLF